MARVASMQLNPAQAEALHCLLSENNYTDEDTGVALTNQSDGELYVAFAESSFHVAPDGAITQEEF